MGHTVRVCATQLNQMSMDFSSNLSRVLRSLEEAERLEVRLRSGPELELCGYSCEDHFLENDTLLHSWQLLLEILHRRRHHPVPALCDFGMPVMHKNVVYNCRVVVVFPEARIVLIRPKMILCDDGNYRESRYFTAWSKSRCVETFHLPRIIQDLNGQKTTSFGDALIATRDTCVGIEICEELWNPRSRHVELALDGAEILLNGSGSYFELRKAYVTVNLVRDATFKSGGCYIFSNLIGGDGSRVYFNGGSCIALNGQMIAQAEQFGLEEVKVVVANVDLEDIRAYRHQIRSRQRSAAETPSFPRIYLEDTLLTTELRLVPSPAFSWTYNSAEEEIAGSPACWLWDYLRRSGMAGFFLPLSGGVDSASTACLVYAMCKRIVTFVDKDGNKSDHKESTEFDSDKYEVQRVLSDVRRITSTDDSYWPQDPRELCSRLFSTCYMASSNSSVETKERADKLASEIGSDHSDIQIDAVCSAMLDTFETSKNFRPKFKAEGGSHAENLALQNIQARVRMVQSYLHAQLLPITKGKQRSFLVLGSANVDEALRGYMTKYDCSSADINPIGGISKTDLKAFLEYAQSTFNLDSLKSILKAKPTAELEPLDASGKIQQSDEEDMGMSYEELAHFGRLRKQLNCGPYSMYCKLIDEWQNKMSLEHIAEKTKKFFRYYAINRHKMTTLTPACHAETYSPDDNRFDHRQFLYNPDWEWQFKAIDDNLALRQRMERDRKEDSLKQQASVSKRRSGQEEGVKKEEKKKKLVNPHK